MAGQLTDLASMFGTGNPFQTEMGIQQYKQMQDQQNQDLAAARQKMTQEAEMHPVDIANKQGLTNQYNASARLSNANAGTHEDALKVLQGVPMQDRIKTAVAENYQKKSTAQQAALSNEMKSLAVYAAQGVSNGGTLPLPLLQKAQQEHPELMQYLTSPQGLARAAQVVTAHNALDADRQKSDSAHRISAAATTGAASITSEAMLKGKKMEIDAGKFNKNAQDANKFIMKALGSGNFEQASTAAKAMSMQLQTQGDAEGAKMYAELAQENFEKAKALKDAAAVEAGKSKANLESLGVATVTPTGAGRNAVPTAKPQNAAPTQLPQAAMSKLQEGNITTFGNGQSWTLENGQPKRIK